MKPVAKRYALMPLWLFGLLTFYSGQPPLWDARYYQMDWSQQLLRGRLQELQRQLPPSVTVAAPASFAAQLASLPHLYLIDRANEADVVVLAYPALKGHFPMTIQETELQLVPELMQKKERIWQEPSWPSLRIWKSRSLQTVLTFEPHT